jgi:hypothetical protein
MSIATSREERDQAAERLADKTVEQLQAELAYWAVAALDHQAEYAAISEKRMAVAELYNEAQAWVTLVSEQLQARRAKAREGAG